MSTSRVAIIAGARTPFVKAGQAFAGLGPLALATHAVRGLIERHQVNASGIEAIAFGGRRRCLAPRSWPSSRSLVL